MDFRAQAGAVKLLQKILDDTTPTQPLVNATPLKPRFEPGQGGTKLERAIPEDEGVSSRMLEELVRALAREKTLDMHGLMVARHGRVLMEADFGAYTHEVWRATFSLCKSVVGLAIGLLWDEGRINLDAKVTSFFEGRGVLSGYGALTVAHLLTMRSGALFNEAGAITVDDWSRGFLDSMRKCEPGTQFDYNSMNTYMLAAIAKKVAGMRLMEYLKPRLFDPLGIETVYWELSPEGVEKGGWGMYMLPEDEMKLGQLLLDGGVWEGRRVISKEWLDIMTTPHSEAPEELGDYDYGYQIWVSRIQRAYLMNGVFGQNVFVFPDTGIVVVTSAANSENFQRGALFDIIGRCFGPQASFPDALARHDGNYAALLGALEDIRKPAQRSRLPMQALEPHMGLYHAQDKRTGSAGLLPLIEQAVKNTYAQGISALMLHRRENAVLLTVFEGDKRCDLPIDLNAAQYFELPLCAQCYRCALTAALTQDEEDNPVLKLRLSFLEIPNVRLMKIHLLEDGLLLRMSEQPGRDYVTDSLETYLTKKVSSRILGPIAARPETDYLLYRIERAFEPALRFGKTEQAAGRLAEGGDST